MVGNRIKAAQFDYLLRDQTLIVNIQIKIDITRPVHHDT